MSQRTPTDTERLDWIERQTNMDAWTARQSESGRGFRLHNTNRSKFKTAREAIDAAIAEDSQRPGGLKERCSYCGKVGHWRPDCPDIFEIQVARELNP